ncbi:bifunctional folylpolyglutamate synthase/dihydrofolate synthase [Qipengyuania zhejiangensis]|uniref:bifunctional folylpolyglutamate synthase/dihydrofolate synthase n=1 Tax=Qipengyuania zhejiangensis TaxID=3077782 RepID=UPI002D76E013|nr:folylpolyglutamate synthase/dihydrofolate synthase family protein [Qipengyuania sp. Z2]
MRDFARSDSPAVQAQLDRLGALSVPQGRLGLATMRQLMGRLGNPHLRLPPVLHVAGTNGKGSTCAFLRAMLEAGGHTVHVTTSPHLVRYNERIRVAGQLISDERLATLLGEILDTGADLDPSFFEVTMAAAFTEFARVPADACIVEVGLGGRFDATNVIDSPIACGIAALGLDHERFLLEPEEGTPDDPIARIAFEKFGIAKTGAPLSMLAPPPAALDTVLDLAREKAIDLKMEGRDWWVQRDGIANVYTQQSVEIELGQPALPGAHQVRNAGLAAAMLQSQGTIEVSADAIRKGVRRATWPARLQILDDGPLTRLIPHCEWLLDGGHNVQAAEMLASYFAGLPKTPRHAIVGMLEAKDWRGFMRLLAPHFRSLVAVPVPGHESAEPSHVANFAKSCGMANAATADNIEMASGELVKMARPANAPVGQIFVGGSLYLAGKVLELNRQLPD